VLRIFHVDNLPQVACRLICDFPVGAESADLLLRSDFCPSAPYYGCWVTLNSLPAVSAVDAATE